MTFGKTLNLGNSIIGVSILAMPYCFVQSGLLLSIVLIVFSGFLTRLSCHFLLKSALISRRRNFELIVNDVLGTKGRSLVEIGLIGFLLGSCVAYFIMIGDLAPRIVSELFDLKYSRQLRIVSVIFVTIFVILPLSLLRSVDSLTSCSLMAMVLYTSLIIKLMAEATDKLMNEDNKIVADKFVNISYWNISGLLTTFPIFCMAMSCQTSLFEIFEQHVILDDIDALKRDNTVIKKAIYMCTFVYITVGLLGYMAFHDQTLYGNILLAFPPSLTTTLTKIGFVTSLLISFPLCLFPCRTSVHSLFIGKMRKTAFQQLNEHTSPTTMIGMSGADDCCSNGDYNKTFAYSKDDNNNGSTNGHSLHSTTTINGSRNLNQLKSNLNSHINNFNDNNHYNMKTYTSLLNDDDGDDIDNLTKTNVGMSFNGIKQKITNDIISINSAQHNTLPSKLYISDTHFKILTVTLLIITVILSLMFPHIEFILGIIFSTAGTTVCFILPAYTFIKIGEHSKIELFLARTLLLIGLAMLIFCTYTTIHNANLNATNEQ